MVFRQAINIFTGDPNDVKELIGLAELKDAKLYKACVAEFLSTLLFIYLNVANLVYAYGSPIGDFIKGDNLAVSACFGFTLFVTILMSRQISGGHINPAVSLGAFFVGYISLTRLVLYTLAQVLGGICGAAIVKGYTPELYMSNGGGCVGIAPVINSAAVAWGAEVIGTFFLVMTVFTTTDPGADPAQSALAPFAIGMSVFVVHIATIPITGTSINPARSFGPAVVAGGDCWNDQWVFWIGPYCGAILAAVVYVFVFATKERRREIEKSSNQVQDTAAATIPK